MGAVGHGRCGFDAQEEAAGGRVGAVVFVRVERGEGSFVGDGEKLARDGRGCRVEDGAGISAEVIDPAADGGGADGRETARGVGNRTRGAIGMERSVDEKEDGQRELLV